MSALDQIQNLLRDLFQFEHADLDFGLYRLLRLKRDEIEAFLTEQLPGRVDEAFSSLSAETRAGLEKQVAGLAERIRKDVAEEALLPTGEIKKEYRAVQAKAVQSLIADYDASRRALAEIMVSDAQKAEVFNHLYTFFSRYYDSGDFIPRRRYGAREVYAVPYHGQETLFHWSNKDQHYVKSGETFRDYAFTVEAVGGPFQVRFVLTQASVPPGNTKGETRFFFPLAKDTAWDVEAKTLRVPFEYRLPTEQEVERFGKNAKGQEAILEAAIPKLLEAVPALDLRAALAHVEGEKNGRDITRLERRIRHFARRRTSDYFIHRDLAGFLKRELEFYLKDQVLHPGDLEGDLEGKRRLIVVIKRLAEEVITFLAQIEEVERRLFEKRKFVLRTDYLVPIKEVPKNLWQEVLRNKAQLAEWKRLFAIEPKKDLFNKTGKVNLHFLESHPTLVVNTALFEPGFTNRLLSAFDDLDDATDGLLIHSENYQALRLLQRKYEGAVKCIYIDPPYNTGSDEFLYKDRYQHSSWLAMMEERLATVRRLMASDGLLFASVDDTEQARLKLLLDAIFLPENLKASIAWQKRFTRSNNAKTFASVKDWVLAYRASATAAFFREPRTGKADSGYANPDNDPRGPWTSASYVNPASKAQRPNLVYPITNPITGAEVVHPTNAWKYEPSEHQRHVSENRLWWGQKGELTYPRLKVFLSEVQGLVPVDLWSYEETGTTDEASIELSNLFGMKVFENPKPIRLVERCASVEVNNAGTTAELMLDFFAGSGTTGHAIIELNRQAGGRRRFILVEMAEFFDTVLLRRIEKVIYAPEWKDGRPGRMPSKDEMARTPRLVKVLRLESYEDALHNLVTEDTLAREAPRAEAYQKVVGDEVYCLQYLASLPLEASASLLALDKLEHPFDYTIEVLTEQGPKTEKVDLVETFNLLYGLHVNRLETWINGEDGRSYRVVKANDREGRMVLVLWRDMAGLDPAVERRFLEDHIRQYGSFNEILINCDSAVPGVKSLDGLFKRLMDEGEA